MEFTTETTAQFTPPDDVKYTAFVLPDTTDLYGQSMLSVHEDGSVTVDWTLLRSFAASHPVDRTISPCSPDFMARCVAHALLSVRDGRVISAGEVA